MTKLTNQNHDQGRYLIQARLPLRAEQERFESLVAASGLSKAEYVRQCCLDAAPASVPSENLQLYGELGNVQNLLKLAAQKSDVPELEAALAQVKRLRLALVGLLAEKPLDEDAPTS